MNLPDVEVLQIEKEVRAQARGKALFIVNLAMNNLRIIVQQANAGDLPVIPGHNVRETLDKVRDVLAQAYFPVQYAADVSLLKQAYEDLKKER